MSIISPDTNYPDKPNFFTDPSFSAGLPYYDERNNKWSALCEDGIRRYITTGPIVYPGEIFIKKGTNSSKFPHGLRPANVEPIVFADNWKLIEVAIAVNVEYLPIELYGPNVYTGASFDMWTTAYMLALKDPNGPVMPWDPTDVLPGVDPPQPVPDPTPSYPGFIDPLHPIDPNDPNNPYEPNPVIPDPPYLVPDPPFDPDAWDPFDPDPLNPFPPNNPDLGYPPDPEEPPPFSFEPPPPYDPPQLSPEELRLEMKKSEYERYLKEKGLHWSQRRSRK